MKQTGLWKTLYLTHQADKMADAARMALQRNRLRELIAYAKENSPYFSALYREVSEDTPLSILPVTNKAEMTEHFDAWMTDRAITREKVDAFMSDLSNVGRKLDGKYLVYTTSGSTGTPCTILYDDTTFHVSSAIGVLRSFARKQDMKRFIRQGGKTVALFADNGFYLGCGSVRYNLRKMPWKRHKLNTCDVRKRTQDIVDLLNDFQPAMIGSYPTALELLAPEQETGNLHIRPAIIMAGGEYLSEEVRERLSRVFGCYVQTNYSCTEGGTMACECKEHHFHINDDWVILEAVDENNKAVPVGTQSAKVLLTNLANRICPLIRFEITDRVVIHDEPCPCGNSKPWLTLEGRTDDILTFEHGVKIAPLSLYAILKEIQGVRRFQLVQLEQDLLELRLVADDKQKSFAEAKWALEDYWRRSGAEAKVRLSEREPETNPISGKFKHIIAKVPT